MRKSVKIKESINKVREYKYEGDISSLCLAYLMQRR